VAELHAGSLQIETGPAIGTIVRLALPPSRLVAGEHRAATIAPTGQYRFEMSAG
jgi:hypothetical protein